MRKAIQFSDLGTLGKIIFVVEGIAIFMGLITLLLIVISITK